jgi:microcompartment protein CcmL/EutN
MSTATFVQAASSGDVLNVIAAFAGGLFIAGALVWAVQFGMRVQDRELPRPRPEEQARLPETGAIREMREVREPDEIPMREDKRERLMPYQLHHASTRRGKDQHRRRWLPGSSGSFGSGGIGHV